MTNDAVDLLRQSVSVAEHLITQIPPDQLQQRYFMAERHWGYYDRLVSALVQSQRLSEAFIYAERAKSLAFLPELNLDAIPKNHTDALISIIRIFNSLPDDQTAILSYFIGQKRVYYWIIREWFPLHGRKPHGKRVPQVIGGYWAPRIGREPFIEGIDLQILLVRGRVDAAKKSDKRVPIAGDHTIRDVLDWTKEYLASHEDKKSRVLHRVGIATQTDGGRTLYEILLKGAELLLQGITRIVIVPDGSLHYLPFEALIREPAIGAYPPPSANTKFLANDFIISYLPSFYLLNSGTNRLGHDHKGPPQFVGFGNLSVAPSRPLIYRGLRFDQLSLAEEEVKVIASLFTSPGNISSISPKLFFGANATKQTFCLVAPMATYLHIATHGVVFEEPPEDTALIFSPPDEQIPPSESAYILRCEEIAKLKLGAKLVVISACRSGLGKFRRGMGIQSLAQAFLQAGAKTVLASLWNVADDRRTLHLMEDFYSALLSGESVAEACASAKRKMIERDPDPFFWAAFVCYGL